MTVPDTPVVSRHELEWRPHPRVPSIDMKPLLTSAQNTLANLNLLRVPASGVIERHVHPDEIETVYVLSGESVLTLGDRELAFSEGQVVAIPKGLEHALRNEGGSPVELLTFFTPPLES